MTSANRTMIARIATPTIRVPFWRLNEKVPSSASRSWVPETTARPSAISIRIRTSALRSERRRQIANPATSTAAMSPATRIAVSSVGKMLAGGGGAVTTAARG